MSYVVGEKADGCVFCIKAEQDSDRKNHVLYRAQRCYVLLNAYPYNSGHVMVVPYQHLSCVTLLDDETRDELFRVAQLCVEVLKSHLGAEGVNMGMNIGQAAGAGIDHHLHLHLVPRWSGDTNYMTTTAETRIVPQDLDGTFEALEPAMKSLLDEKLG
ncbi:MAG: HIT family protein [Armatimonadota bacterium]